MNSGNFMMMGRVLLAVFLLLGAGPKVLAEGGVPFTQVAPPNDPDPNLIGRMKYQAVVEYLQNALGGRYPEFERYVTPEFAEEYILEFSRGRSAANRAQVELTGKLNSDGLKRWVRIMEAKSKGGGNSSGTLFLVSSAVPGVNLAGYDTGSRVRDNPVARETLSLLNGSLSKFNLKLDSRDVRVSTTPARSEDEVRSLRDAASSSGHSKVVWVFYSACKSCGGVRLDLYFYNLLHNRPLVQRSEDLSIDPRELANTAKLSKVLKAPLHQFQGEMEELVSSGMVSSATYHVVVENIDSYRGYKGVETEISQLDFVVQAFLSRAEPKLADFEVFTNLSSEELLKRLGATDFPGFRLKPVRFDSGKVVVRYLKQG